MNASKAICSTKRYGTLFFLVIMIMGFVTVFAQDTENDNLIAEDLLVALTMQGINCNSIREIERKNEKEYDVVCDDGGSYRVNQSKEGFLGIVNLLTGIVYKGVDGFLGIIHLPGQFFPLTGELTEQSTEVARSLLSIVRLSGNDCEAITVVDRKSSDEHIVSCVRGQDYHVYTTEDGLVTVDVISTSGD